MKEQDEPKAKQVSKKDRKPLSKLDQNGELNSNKKRALPDGETKVKGEKKKKAGNKLKVDKEIFKGKPTVEPLPTKSSNGLDIDDLV